MSAETVQVDPPVPEDGRGPSARRLGWGVASQAVSSASNFLLGVFIAKSLGVASLGAFSLAYVTYSVILNGSRGLSTDPLVVRFSGPSNDAWRRAVSAASGAALAIGVLSGVVCTAGGVLLWAFATPPAVGLAFITLALGLPGLLLQDSWRFAFFSSGQGAKAFANDVVWTVLMVGAIAVAWAMGRNTLELSLLIFGGTATMAALIGLAQSRIMPRPGLTSSWLKDNRHLGPRYLVENVSNSGASQIRAFVLGVAAGLVAVGQVRGAEMLIGPFLVILFGVAQVAVPEARRAMHRGGNRLLRFCMSLAAALAVTSIVWGVAILVLLPLGLGDAILGSVWEPAYELAPGVIVSATAACLSVGAASGLRALGQARRSLRAQLTATSLYLVTGCGGAIVWGAKGAVWGAAVAGMLGAAGWWIYLHRGLREGPFETRPNPSEEDPTSGAPEVAPSNLPTPRLTIGLPTYNGERYLSESLECLLGQTFEDFELLISDNASTDGTAAICKEFEILDPRVRYVRQSRNIGSAANHNFVVDHARGELFKWASDDDLYHRDLVRRCVELLDADDTVVVTHSLDAFVDEEGRVIQANPYELDTRSNSPVTRFCSLLYGRGGNDIYGVMRTDVMRRTHGHGSYHNADRTLVAELALHGRFDHVPEVLYYRRDHPGRAERATGETRARAANLDPRRLSQSKLRLLLDYVGGYLGAIHTAPLSAWQKARCRVHLTGYVASRLVPLHKLGAMQSNDPAVRERASHSRIVRLRAQMLGGALPAEQEPIDRPRVRPTLGEPVHEESPR